MTSKEFSIDDVIVQTDPITRPREDNNDNVMEIFPEEQPAFWDWIKEELRDTITHTSGMIDLLDVGTGSGILALLTAKHTQARTIIALDVSLRAIEMTRSNARRNTLEDRISCQYEPYSMNSAPYKECKVIGMNPPYHLYPPETAPHIPQHARGGTDGQQLFREHLVTANYHLAPGGIIIFHQMCLGRHGIPEFVRYIPYLLDDTSLSYTSSLPMIQTEEFMRRVYADHFPIYQSEISTKFPELYFCNGVIRRDGRQRVKEVFPHRTLCDTSWDNRIELHRMLARHIPGII